MLLHLQLISDSSTTIMSPSLSYSSYITACFLSLAHSATDRSDSYSQVLKSNEGKWGSWTGWVYCNEGQWANTYAFQTMWCSILHICAVCCTQSFVYQHLIPLSQHPILLFCNTDNSIAFNSESNQGLGDDVAGNGVKLICETADNPKEYEYETSAKSSRNKEGWGSWYATNPEACPSGSWLTGFRTSVEGSCGAFCDDTALNCIQVQCSDGTVLKPTDCRGWGGIF